MSQFNEETIKVSHPNLEIFVAAFQHGLCIGQFNELWAQKLVENMDEIITRAECYVKGEESNMGRRPGLVTIHLLATGQGKDGHNQT